MRNFLNALLLLALLAVVAVDRHHHLLLRHCNFGLGQHNWRHYPANGIGCL